MDNDNNDMARFFPRDYLKQVSVASRMAESITADFNSSAIMAISEAANKSLDQQMSILNHSGLRDMRTASLSAFESLVPRDNLVSDKLIDIIHSGWENNLRLTSGIVDTIRTANLRELDLLSESIRQVVAAMKPNLDILERISEARAASMDLDLNSSEPVAFEITILDEFAYRNFLFQVLHGLKGPTDSDLTQADIFALSVGGIDLFDDFVSGGGSISIITFFAMLLFVIDVHEIKKKNRRNSSH